ncbi:MAG: ATP-dependent DNA helicase [Archangiaceae bacterium]|nr:ATP-dependent DNA helicase [Archangiaceae bacterium]
MGACSVFFGASVLGGSAASARAGSANARPTIFIFFIWGPLERVTSLRGCIACAAHPPLATVDCERTRARTPHCCDEPVDSRALEVPLFGVQPAGRRRTLSPRGRCPGGDLPELWRRAPHRAAPPERGQRGAAAADQRSGRSGRSARCGRPPAAHGRRARVRRAARALPQVHQPALAERRGLPHLRHGVRKRARHLQPRRVAEGRVAEAARAVGRRARAPGAAARGAERGPARRARPALPAASRGPARRPPRAARPRRGAAAGGAPPGLDAQAQERRRAHLEGGDAHRRHSDVSAGALPSGASDVDVVVSRLDSILGPGGSLSRALTGYEARPQQLELAHAVERAFTGRHALLAEAGTGTGKTLAYLVPAALSGRRVIISTATRALQEQVFFKDIPLLERAGLEVKSALLKGRVNYLCLSRFAQFDAQPLFEAPEDATHWPAFRSWTQSTATGDRGETQLPDAWGPWSRLSTPSESCAGSRCPDYERCWVTKARRHASESRLIVVNHALFFADLVLKSRAAQVAERRKARGQAEVDISLSVLPDYDAVVFDEAHALEDVATEHFGLSVNSARLIQLSQEAVRAAQRRSEQSGMLASLGLSLREKTDAYFRFVAGHLGLSENRGDARLRQEQLGPLQTATGPLLETLSALGALCARAAEDSSDLTKVIYEGLKRRAQDAAEALSFVLEVPDGSHVHWASMKGRTVWLRAAPIEVGESLSKWLYRATDTVVFTSATLATGAGMQAFGYVKERLGLEPEARAVKVDSPFDYPNQCGLYLPRHMPEPQDPGFTDAVCDEVLELTKLTSGRAFVLFTSLRHMEAVHARVAPLLEQPALLQGERPKRALLEAFVAEPSVLFASQSFWEGVDVPGDALSLVIIDKLPFAPPDEPLMAARIEALKERGENAFEAHQVPSAALSLRQGFGRLIRTRRDFGIVALLDSRLTHKRYGKTFIDALPPARKLYRLEDVKAFWRAGAYSETPTTSGT